MGTEVAGKISFVLYVKVSNDPESAPIPVQSRDFTALAGRDNVCTNLGKPYPCIAKDLDYPQEKGYLVGQERERDGSATWIGGFHLPLGQRSFVDLHSNVAADVNSSSVS